MQNNINTKAKKEIEKLNRLIAEALKNGSKLTDEKILKQSYKVDEVVNKMQAKEDLL
jgi:hypothetical protein